MRAQLEGLTAGSLLAGRGESSSGLKGGLNAHNRVLSISCGLLLKRHGFLTQNSSGTVFKIDFGASLLTASKHASNYHFYCMVFYSWYEIDNEKYQCIL